MCKFSLRFHVVLLVAGRIQIWFRNVLQTAKWINHVFVLSAFLVPKQHFGIVDVPVHPRLPLYDVCNSCYQHQRSDRNFTAYIPVTASRWLFMHCMVSCQGSSPIWTRPTIERWMRRCAASNLLCIWIFFQRQSSNKTKRDAGGHQPVKQLPTQLYTHC